MTDVLSNDFVDVPERQCYGKFAYHSKSAAKTRIRRMRGAEDREHLHAYRCCHCGAFHIGHRR